MLTFALSVCLILSLGHTVRVIQTNVGEIHGIEERTLFNNKALNVTKFLGIPYAEPPVGSLRFRKPRPAKHFQTPFIANQFGPGCLQNKFLMSMWLPGNVPMKIFPKKCFCSAIVI